MVKDSTTRLPANRFVSDGIEYARYTDGRLGYERVTSFTDAAVEHDAEAREEAKKCCSECGQVKAHQNHWAPFGWHDFVTEEGL